MKENKEETSHRPVSDIPGVNAALSGIQEMLERQWPQIKEVGLDHEKKETGVSIGLKIQFGGPVETITGKLSFNKKTNDEFQAVADDPNQEKFNI